MLAEGIEEGRVGICLLVEEECEQQEKEDR